MKKILKKVKRKKSVSIKKKIMQKGTRFRGIAKHDRKCLNRIENKRIRQKMIRRKNMIMETKRKEIFMMNQALKKIIKNTTITKKTMKVMLKMMKKRVR